eukprot:12107811-Karenia_brevis.AAC.1
MAQIMLEIRKYENGEKVVGQKADEEAPTRGTAVFPEMGRLRPPNTTNRTNNRPTGEPSKANIKNRLKRVRIARTIAKNRQKWKIEPLPPKKLA